MVVTTRSQCDAAESEGRRRAERQAEAERIEAERLRGASVNPPDSPSTHEGEQRTLDEQQRTFVVEMRQQQRKEKSPSRSVRSKRTTDSTRRLRLAELEAAEKLADINRKELELQIEADLIKKRLALQQATINKEEGSVRGETEEPGAARYKVNEWLEKSPLARGEPDRGRSWERAERSRTPTGRSNVALEERLVEAMERMARPQRRYNCDLRTFSGDMNEWLAFRAAYEDSTKLYAIPTTENLLRLRSCLKGEARESVAGMLHSAIDPNDIMKSLEQSFGRPENLIEQVKADIKKLPKLGTTSPELNKFAVKVQNSVYTLKKIHRRHLDNPNLAREVLERLNPYMVARYRDYAREDATDEPEIVLLSRFLMKEADEALRFGFMPSPPQRSSTSKAAPSKTAPSKAVPPNAGGRRKTAVYATDGAEETDRCPSCGSAHALHRCPNYRALRVEQRWDLVRGKGLCFRCVEKKHRRIHCKAKLCGVNECRRPHHSTLHEDSTEPAARSAAQPQPERRENHDSVVLAVAPRVATESNVVCPVVVSGPRGEIETYALLDDGAAITLIDHELAESVGADGPTRPLRMSGASANMLEQEGDSKLVTIYLRGKRENALFKLKAQTIRSLELRRQTVPKSLLRESHLRHLAEEEVCYDRARPLLLVGSDHLEVVMTREARVGGPNRPAAVKTALGWVVQGSAPRSMIYSDSESILHVYAPDPRVRKSEANDLRLHELVEHHFRIDSLGVALKPRVSDADERAIRTFEETVKKIYGGYEVGLPWRHDQVVMPPSYAAAANRLRGIERKMDADPAFAKEYSAQVDNLLAKGYAVPCDGTESQSAICWYLPHFAVENPNKPGKRRLVFDAAHRNRGVCLNDLLLEGPDLLLSLPGIIFRFRERAIAVIADIQEMFLRVKIRPADQPAQQFLWRGEDRSNPPRLYKMTSMIFGAASSPFLAHSVRNHNAYAHAESHPRALMAITKSHYMDDFVDSYSSVNEARRTIEELRAVHAVAGFTLRGWSSNRPEVLIDVPAELRASELTQLGGASSESKILGLCWDANEDELGFNTTMPRVPADVRSLLRAPTKREALSVVMSIYDPLGLLSQYTIRAKIILQSLWRLQMPWDEPIPGEEAEQFAAWLQQLNEITQLRLPRSYALEGHRDIELHVMCDASDQAYATVAYWRAVGHDNGVSIALIAAKAKVAPRLTQSIPRLELQAAVIGARLADTIKKEHRLEITRTIYWTDSATVVHWIRNDARRYTPFVAHRLGEIAELTHRDEWRWLPTDHNVADDATRLNCVAISIDDRWFQGPRFLLDPEAEWPSQQGLDQEEGEATTRG